jgi:hypothetical protein
MADPLDLAARDALKTLQDHPKEHIGAIYDKDGNLGRTSTADGSDSHVKGKLQFDGQLKALFHNHPSRGRNDRDGNEFSDDDKAQARRLGVPSYIITPSGLIRVFDPISNTTRDVE